MEYYQNKFETSIQKLARLEKELAEVRESIQNEQDTFPDVCKGQFYKRRSRYYILIIFDGDYILYNLACGSYWVLSGDSQDELKKELSVEGFEFIDIYKNFLKEVK